MGNERLRVGSKVWNWSMGLLEMTRDRGVHPGWPVEDGVIV